MVANPAESKTSRRQILCKANMAVEIVFKYYASPLVHIFYYVSQIILFWVNYSFNVQPPMPFLLRLPIYADKMMAVIVIG